MLRIFAFCYTMKKKIIDICLFFKKLFVHPRWKKITNILFLTLNSFQRLFSLVFPIESCNSIPYAIYEILLSHAHHIESITADCELCLLCALQFCIMLVPKTKTKTKKLCTPIKCNEFWKLYTKRTICKSNGKLFNKNIAIFDVNEVLFWFALRITFEFMSCKINRYVHIDFSMQTENVVALVAHNFFSLNNSMIKPRVIVCASFLFYLLPFVL